MRPTRAIIDSERFVHNLQFVRSRIDAEAKIMAVVKANAYGHGIEHIVKAAIHSGLVEQFGVATEEEAIGLRALTDLPILVLTGLMMEEIDSCLKHKLDITVSELELIEPIGARAEALGTKANIHLKVDTGMRRMGIEPQDIALFLGLLDRHSDRIVLKGLSTHFATSDELDSSFFHRQLGKFESVRSLVFASGHRPTVHAANSGAILQFPRECSFDMVRPGIMLYGYTPSSELDSIYGDELLPVLTLESHVVHVKRIKKGEGVSYGLRWHAPKDTTIATVPIGYGDGYFRILTNRTRAKIREKFYDVVGTICMDQVMIDVGDDAVSLGETAQFISSSDPHLSAWSIAKEIGTIPYEVLTNISARVPRVLQVSG